MAAMTRKKKSSYFREQLNPAAQKEADRNACQLMDRLGLGNPADAGYPDCQIEDFCDSHTVLFSKGGEILGYMDTTEMENESFTLADVAVIHKNNTTDNPGTTLEEAIRKIINPETIPHHGTITYDGDNGTKSFEDWVQLDMGSMEGSAGFWDIPIRNRC